MSDLYSNKQVRERAEQLVRNEVFACASSLVYNLTPDACAAMKDCSYEDDLMPILSQPDYESAAEQWLDDADIDDLRSMADTVAADYDMPDENDDGDEVEGTGSTADQIREAIKAEHDWAKQVCEDQRLEPDEREAYEHWIVSSWFADKLKEQGEMVGELFNWHVWGRCTTGQGIAMDGVILSIAAELEARRDAA